MTLFSHDRSLRSEELALLGKGTFDVPHRIRNLLILAGACGIVIAIVASLVGNTPDTVDVDNLLHFSGYGMLSFVFVLALRPKWFVPALAGLAALGYFIELVQPLNARSREFGDVVANCLGLLVGLAAGLIARNAYAWVRKELSTRHVRRQLRNYPAGATILREGGHVTKLYIIKSGEVRILKQLNGQRRELARLGPGKVFGLLGFIQAAPQYATVEAVTPASVYGMDMSELRDCVGGDEHPVAMVLSTFAEKTQELVQRLEATDSALARPTSSLGISPEPCSPNPIG